jgi:hypothetical protein
MECPVLRPTLGEVHKQSWQDYISKHEGEISEAGVAKIVAPAGWSPRTGYDEDLDVRIKPIRQHASGARGVFRWALAAAWLAEGGGGARPIVDVVVDKNPMQDPKPVQPISTFCLGFPMLTMPPH